MILGPLELEIKKCERMTSERCSWGLYTDVILAGDPAALLLKGRMKVRTVVWFLVNPPPCR